MNNKIRSLIHYIIKYYPYSDDLSKTRITKLVYLIDWEMVCVHNRQLTPIEWYFDHYGPYVSDVLDVADEDEDISITKTISAYGGTKYIVEAKYDKNELSYQDLDSDEIEIINKIIENTKQLTWNEFIDYVYNTAPVKKTERYNNLDLKQYIKN